MRIRMDAGASTGTLSEVIRKESQGIYCGSSGLGARSTAACDARVLRKVPRRLGPSVGNSRKRRVEQYFSHALARNQANLLA